MSFWNAFSITTRYTELPHSLFSYVNPSPLNNTRWAAWNDALAQQFGFPSDPEHAPELLSVFSGESVPLLFKPLAMKYAGHQFGGYNPDLGDGRGLLLGEIKNKEGIYFDFHIKGAGQTPYSRMGDGRAVLRSTVREYLCSEAMAGLNIPTTRALGMMTSDGVVVREGYETGALLIRVTETHIRFGHFEHLFYSNLLDEHKQLADKVIEWHFPHCLNADKPYLMMFTEIVDRTAQMIAHWQAVGFSHGVMNTDNMSIIGQTFDYGPFGFLDDYEPGYICNHSDYQGRYAFNQQPRIGLWNLSALAHSLSPLIDKADLEDALTQYEDLLHRYFSQLMRGKLGLISKQDGDSRLFESMFELLSQNGADYTCFMRSISCLDRNEKQTIIDLFIDREAATLWVDLYLSRCELEERGVFERCQNMRTVNPKYILRNYLAQKAIDKAQSGDFSEVEILSMLLTNPFDEHSEFESYSQLPPEWGKKMEISCSS